MRNFFLNYNDGFVITLFSKYHLIIIALTIFIVGLIIYKRNYFTNLSDKAKKRIRVSFALILLINLIIRRGSFIYYDVYNWHFHLDINFCNFNNLLYILYGLTGNKKIFNICCYMTFVGPLLSIIFPSTNVNPYNYSFYSFILIHHIIFIFNFIFIFMNKKVYNIYSLKEANKFIFYYHIGIYFFDYLFKLNYNFPDTFINADIIAYFFNKDINIRIMFIFYIFVVYILTFLANCVIKKIINYD